ncbi:hypothetical protein ACJX0J_041432 [Zea mays]
MVNVIYISVLDASIHTLLLLFFPLSLLQTILLSLKLSDPLLLLIDNISFIFVLKKDGFLFFHEPRKLNTTISNNLYAKGPIVVGLLISPFFVGMQPFPNNLHARV